MVRAVAVAAALASTAILGGVAGPVGRSDVPAAGTAAVAGTDPPLLEVAEVTWDDGELVLADGAVTRDWGVAAAPVGGGPFPVVVVLHGSHSTCPTDIGGGTWPCPPGTEVPNHEGLAYLADAIAARGFVAVVPGINVQYTLGAGEPAAATRTAEIVEHVLAGLEHGTGPGFDPAVADLSRLVLVGHSVGGQDAGLLAAGRTSFTRPVAGVVMLQPALNDAAALPLADVPAVVVLSECDGDTGLRGGTYVTTALQSSRRSPAAIVVLEGANHNFTNAGLAADAFPVEAPACDPGRVMEPDAQRDLLAGVVPELVHAVLGDGGGAGWAGSVFDAPAAPPGVLVDAVAAGESPAPVPGPGPDVPDALVADGMTLTFCPEGYYTAFAYPGTEPCHRPELAMMVGYPQTVAASWDAGGASLTLPVEAGPGDVARLRLLPDFADERLDRPLVVRLSADDGTATGPVVEAELPLPERRREQIGPFAVTFGLAMWSTVTLPLPQGASEIRLDVVGPPAGSLQVVSLGVEPH